MKRPLLEARNISKSFFHPNQVDIFQDISLQLFAGESVAIVGRSGEGKSTLLQILGTLEKPCSGSLFIDEKRVNSANHAQIRNTKIGFVFQFFHLLEGYTVLENVLMPARIAGQSVRPNGPMEQRAQALLQKVGLQDRAHFQTKLLSGGEKQRVALARAMCNDPLVILADEPSGNLDSDTARTVHDILLEFPREKSRALLIVTHNRELSKRCTRSYELRGGVLI